MKHSYTAIIALLVPGLVASPMFQQHANGTSFASNPSSSASHSVSMTSSIDASAIASAVTALGGLVSSIEAKPSSSVASSSSTASSTASSSSSTPSDSAYQTNQYMGLGGSGENWGVEGPEKMLDWLVDQCGDGECPGTLQYSGNNWPAPITGQNSGHMELTIVSSYRSKDVLKDKYIPAFKSFWAANQNSTKQYYDDNFASGQTPGMAGMAGPLPSVNIITAPGYFGLRRYPANNPTAGPSDWVSITAKYVSDDRLAQFLCHTMIGLGGMAGDWEGFFGSLLDPVCDEL